MAGSAKPFRTRLPSAGAVKVTVARVPRPNVSQTLDVPSGTEVGDIVRQVGAHPDAVIVIREERPLPLDAPVRDGDVLRVVNVFSGG